MKEVKYTIPGSSSTTLWSKKNLVDGIEGDLWRCDTCDTLWIVKIIYWGNEPGRFTWVEAGWFKRLRYRKK